jgi:hypothetical protein
VSVASSGGTFCARAAIFASRASITENRRIASVATKTIATPRPVKEADLLDRA